MSMMYIGIDNYGLYPMQLDPMQTLQWAKDHGAEGVQFSGLDPKNQKKIDKVYLKDLLQYTQAQNMYLEWGGGQHIPRDMTSWAKKDLFAINEKVAKEAEILGTRIVRSCSGGLMRWKSDSPPTETLLQETAEALKSQRQMLRDRNVILALETHFEFTTFELRRLFDLCEAAPGDYLGICLDTMNLLTMLEYPVSATDRILSWVVCTHLKDGAVKMDDEGLVTFPTEIGKGVVDLNRIIQRLQTLSWDINLSIEDHGGEFHIPIFDSSFLSRFPDLTSGELAELMRLIQITQQRKCEIITRDKWSEICEDRLSRDIIALKKLNKN